MVVNITRDRCWWPAEWTPEKVCNAGKLVSSLELKVLGAPAYVLGSGASQHQVGVRTHLSEEVNRVFLVLVVVKDVIDFD